MKPSPKKVLHLALLNRRNSPLTLSQNISCLTEISLFVEFHCEYSGVACLDVQQLEALLDEERAKHKTEEIELNDLIDDDSKLTPLLPPPSLGVIITHVFPDDRASQVGIPCTVHVQYRYIVQLERVSVLFVIMNS